MKKLKPRSESSARPVRILDQPALTGASGGTLDPYIGQQHNETLTCVRRQRRRPRR